MPASPPPWMSEAPPAGSWRSIFKWGDPGEFKHPNSRLTALMKDVFGMEAADFAAPVRAGLGPVEEVPGPELPEGSLAAFRAMLGEGGVRTDAYARIQAASGKTMLDLLRLREGTPPPLPAAVLYPRNRHDVLRIVEHCAARGIPITPRGGGSSVTRALECPRGGVVLDLTRHMNKVLAFSETDQTITVEPGLYGPALEGILNRAPALFGARRPYTCGHFPQSFEFSTVGGWIAARGAGQNSTYYGRIEDLVRGLECVTPAGVLRTASHPARAMGPDTNQILLGGEGTFGILTEATLRIFRHLPGNRRRFSFIFPAWSGALEAAREILQGEEGMPSVFRLSDPEETDIALRLYGVDRPAVEAFLRLRGLRRGERCLLLGSADGGPGHVRATLAHVARCARRAGGVSTTGLVEKAWEHGRYRDPYLREDLQDFGIVTDTLECAVTWDALERVHREVRAVCHARPRTLCMTHLSHGYPQGANLYFIFITRMGSIPDYLAYQARILEAFRAQGAALSHHHGIGRMAAPWMEGQLGAEQMELFRALKRHLDPPGILNPGGTLGLDLPPEERR